MNDIGLPTRHGQGWWVVLAEVDGRRYDSTSDRILEYVLAAKGSLEDQK